MEGKLMNTRELAQKMDAPEYFVRRELRAAKSNKRVAVTRIPGQGRFYYADPTEFAIWLRERGFELAANRLETA